MKKYIFLDNWVFSRLTDDNFFKKLSSFLKANDYTILLTSQLITEIYNPNWENSAERDRGLKAADFISKHSCVIVETTKIFELEYSSFPKNLNIIPVDFDFNKVEDNLRLETFLGLLRRNQVFLDQGKDIGRWDVNLRDVKGKWFDDVDGIIQHAIQDGTLKKDPNGNFIKDSGQKEVFLTSLDLRLVENVDVSLFLAKASKYRNKTGKLSRMRGARITSLCIWYTYIEIDETNKLKRSGSDIVDYLHLSLIPYCSAFTVDNTMYKLLGYVGRDINISNCKIYTPQTLEEAISI